MLISSLVFAGWAFCSLVSVALSDLEKGVMAPCFPVGNSSGIQIGVATGAFWVKCVSRYRKLTLGTYMG